MFFHLEKGGWICPIPLVLGRNQAVCGGRACYTSCWMNSPMKRSGRWLFPPTKCERLHRSWPSYVQPTLRCTFCYFSPCPYCRKSLLSKTGTVSTTGKQLLLKEQMTGLQIAAQRGCMSQFVREWSVPWCKTEIRRKESGFPSFF